MPQIQLPYQITYETTKDVPVALVARSLLAHEALIRESVKLIGKLYDGAEIQVEGVRVESVSNASPLKELLAIGIFIAFQEDLEREVPALFTHLTGVPVTEDYNAILTVIGMLLAVYVVDQVVHRFFPGKDAKQMKVEYENKRDALAKLCDKSAEEIDCLVRDSVSNNLRLKLINAAFDFFSPSVRGGSVPITGPAGHAISQEAVSEVPRDLDFLMNEAKESYLLEGAVIDIHRADRDSNKAGWRAIIDAVSEDKIRMELAPDIDPNALYGKTSVTGDVFVVEERNKNGILAPKMFHLMRVEHDSNG